MFLQAVIEYAQSRLRSKLQEEAWEERRVPYLVELDSDGTYAGIVERMKHVQRGKTAFTLPETLTVPRSPVDRKSGVQPLLGVDDIRYVLGVGAWTRETEHANHQERHQAFMQLITKAAEATHDPSLEACRLFYGRPEEVRRAREALNHVPRSCLVGLSVGGPVVIRSEVRDYWNKHYSEAFASRVAAGHQGECLVSGKLGTVLPTHEKIKGMLSLGGQSAGVSLISFSKEAFRSYGWVQNQNSPVCPECAMAYVIGFNELLNPANHRRKDLAGVGFLFWLQRDEDFNLFACLDEMDRDRVEGFLAHGSEANSNDNVFYMLACSANGGRLRVRCWVSQSLTQVKRSLGEWFMGLRVDGCDDSPQLVPFWRVLTAIHRDGVPAAHNTIALIRRAVEGRSHPLGNEILAAALTQLRRGGQPRPEQIGLIRLCVNDLIYCRQTGERAITESLDPGQTKPAYLCGRLLAQYEWLQIVALKVAGKANANVSVAAGYYSLALTNPAVAFPRLEARGRMHLQTLRRRNMASARAIESKIRDLYLLLEKANQHRFPSVLSLEDQGRFMLGFYHQRTDSMARAKGQERKQELD